MDYRSNQDMLIAAWLLFGMTAFFVAMRVYVRLQSRPRLFGNDDRFLALSLALFLVQLAILTDVMHMTHNGTFFRPRQVKKACIQAWLLHLLYSQIIWSAKLSLFLLYRRLLSGLCMQKQLRGAAVLLGVSWVFVTILYAIPLIGFTAGDPRQRQLFNRPQHIHDVLQTYCIGPLDVLTSIVLTLLPFALLRRLRINAKEKTALVLIFSLGLLCICAAILRWVVLLEISTASIFILWSTLEQSCLIMVQSLMVLRPLLYQIFELVGIDKTGHRESVHQLSANLKTRQVQHNAKALVSTKHHPYSPYNIDLSETMDSVDTSNHLMKCLELNSPGPSLSCSTLTAPASEASTVRHGPYLEMDNTDAKPNMPRAAWSAIQIEQTYAHSFETMCRDGFMQHNRTEVYAGRMKAQPRHPVKAKSLGAIPRYKKDSIYKAKHASTFSEFQADSDLVSDNRLSLRLVP